MQKKHLCLSLLLLQPLQARNISPGNWVQDMMQEMEESFTRMQDGFSRMQEAFSKSLPIEHESAKPHIRMKIEKQPECAQFTLQHVEEGSIDAQYDGNTLHIKHPEFSVHIRQMRDRYNRTGLSIAVESEQNVTQEEGKKTYKHSSYSSSMENISLEKPIILDEPEIMYDEEKKELTVKLMYKTQKRIPINIKKAE